jgi:GntR family transcriptional regulator/MocR family aminotransferase
VVGGAQAGLDLVSRMLLDPGDTAWMEEPGYPGARGALLGAGARLHPVPVDDDGLDVAAGERAAPRARLAYVTPSYQYPLGTTMSLERRLRLLEWAQRANSWVIEDDYDSEYRYRGRPLSALQGLDTAERVIYVGTFSKTMFPALRLAYLVVPRGLVTVFRRALRHTGQDAPVAIQAAAADFISEGHYASHLAAADFISEGHYASHLRRMRGLYAERLQRFTRLLNEQLGHVLELGPVDAGMQLATYLPHSMDDREIARRAEEAGINVAALSTFYLRECPQPGLLLGYAAVPEAEMRAAVDSLRELMPVTETRELAYQ